MRNTIAVFSIGLLLALPCRAEETSKNAERVFRDYAERIVQVRVIENVSGVKSSLGSGFYASANGLIVTNYHVISSTVFHPDRYRIEVFNKQSETSSATLSYVDVVHDLALLQVDEAPPSFFKAASRTVANGTEIFAFGNPHDLGMAIVEGIYNGIVENSRFEKIHFTGSLNSGMSGGPAVTADGSLVGVNVSGMGDQVSFLVPARFVAEMIESYNQHKDRSTLRQMQLIEEQLLADQHAAYQELFSQPLPTVPLGDYQVPSNVLPALKCWSNSKTLNDRRYSFINHQCSFSDSIYLNSEFRTGSIYLFYNYISGERLNPFQFASLLENHLDTYGESEGGTEDDVTKFRCIHDFIDNGSGRQWVNACFRAYRRMPSLYDVALVSASLNEDKRALLSYIRAKGISFPNAKRLMTNMLNGIQWQKDS